MTARISLSQVRGDDLLKTVTLDQALSGLTEIWFTIRHSDATTETDDLGAVFSGSLTGGEISAVGANTFTISATAAETVLWSASSYVYDIQVKTTGGKIYTAAYGKLRMQPDVTRSTS